MARIWTFHKEEDLFPYHGEIKELAQVLEEYRPRLRQVYQQILGNRFFKMLEKTDQELLKPVAFRSLTEIRALGPRAKTANKFLMGWAAEDESEPQFQQDGSFTLPAVEVTPGFVFDQESFMRSKERYEKWIDPFLGPYIHEYDHFLLFAIQEHPMLLAQSILAVKLKVDRFPLELEDIPRLVVLHGGTREEMYLQAFLGTWAYSIQEAYETSTRILDCAVYEALGFQVPRHYKDVPHRVLLPLPFPFLNMVCAFPVGDIMYGKSIRERLTTLSDWVRRMTPSHEIQAHFLTSFQKVTVTKVPFPELSEEENI